MVRTFSGGVDISKGLTPPTPSRSLAGTRRVYHSKLSAIGLVATFDMLEQACASKMKDIAAAMDLPPGKTVRAGPAILSGY